MKKLAGVLFVVGCLASISGCRTSKQGYVAKGNKLFDAGKYADAAINYGKAIQKDKGYGEAYYRLGLAEIKEQKPREAFDALYRAFQLMPADFNVKEQLGSLALEYYLLDPQRPQSYYRLLRQISDELLAKNPKSFEGLREQAYLAMTDGKRDESTVIFRKALAVRPSDPTVATALIQNLIVTGHGMEAERMALDLIARQKSYGEVYNVLYGWYLKNNRPADAENILKSESQQQSEARRLPVGISRALRPTTKTSGDASQLAALARRSQGFSASSPVGRGILRKLTELSRSGSLL